MKFQPGKPSASRQEPLSEHHRWRLRPSIGSSRPSSSGRTPSIRRCWPWRSNTGRGEPEQGKRQKLENIPT
jgi:hypothetical protein